MNKKTLIALGTFAALCLVALFTLRSPEKGERVGERPRPVPKLKAGDFDTLEITRGGATTVVKKEGDKHKVAAPLAYAADDFAAKQAFETVEKLEFGNIVTDQKAKHAELEVGDGAVRVVVKKADKALADLVVGKPLNSYSMVRVSGDDKVWQAVGSLKSTFDKDTTGWRDKSITTFAAADVEKLEIVSKTGGKIALKRNVKPDAGAADDAWSVVESSVKIDELDKTVASSIVSTLGSFKANDFVDAAKVEETGLESPQFTLTATVKGGKTVTALVGGKKGEDDFYVKAADEPQVFLVKKYGVERIMKRPIDFRDKIVCNIADTDLAEVAVAHGSESFTIAKSGSEWKGTKPAGLELDSTKVSTITSAFQDWKGTGFAEDPSPKATGLAKPTATITARAADKKTTCILKVGGETADKQGYHLQPAGSSDVYVVGKWTVDRVLKKIDDIKKPGTTVAKKS